MALRLRDTYPDIRVIRATSNLGFAAGNNRGIAAAQGDYIFTLNNDVEVEPDALDEMVTSWVLSDHDYPLEGAAVAISDVIISGLKA